MQISASTRSSSSRAVSPLTSKHDARCDDVAVETQLEGVPSSRVGRRLELAGDEGRHAVREPESAHLVVPASVQVLRELATAASARKESESGRALIGGREREQREGTHRPPTSTSPCESR